MYILASVSQPQAATVETGDYWTSDMSDLSLASVNFYNR